MGSCCTHSKAVRILESNVKMKLLLLVFLCLWATLAGASERLSSEPIVPIPYPQITDLELAGLGYILFRDKRLSANNTMSCNSCHILENWGMDNAVVSVGLHRQMERRNTPTVFNSSLHFKQFWDGRANTLEEQIDGPVNDEMELASSWEQIISKLKKDPFYRLQFNKIFPQSGITQENIKLAIASFERLLLTPDSPFDRYLKGDDHAISDEAREGYRLFKEYGCTACHQGVAVGGNMFGKLGVIFPYYSRQDHDDKDLDYGRYAITGREQDKFVFKVPSLRNVEKTAPYFHDGSVKTLHQAVSLMIKYQLGKRVIFRDVARIVSFLKTLTAELELPQELKDFSNRQKVGGP